MGEYVVVIVAGIFIAVGVAFKGKLLIWGKGNSKESAEDDLMKQSEGVMWKEKEKK
jgi:hypothetical protein